MIAKAINDYLKPHFRYNEVTMGRWMYQGTASEVLVIQLNTTISIKIDVTKNSIDIRCEPRHYQAFPTRHFTIHISSPTAFQETLVICKDYEGLGQAHYSHQYQ